MNTILMLIGIALLLVFLPKKKTEDKPKTYGKLKARVIE